LIGLTKSQREELAAAQKVVRRLKAKPRNQAKKQRAPKIQPVAKEQRQVRERDPGFLAYLRRQPCEARGYSPCEGPIEAAHIRYSDAKYGANPGMGRKNHDRCANPLCRVHHTKQHHVGDEAAFWKTINKNAYETAARHYAAYQGNQPVGAHDASEGGSRSISSTTSYTSPLGEV
jgi:hypothetical protein